MDDFAAEAAQNEADMAVRRGQDGEFLPDPNASEEVRQAVWAAIQAQRLLRLEKARLKKNWSAASTSGTRHG